VPAVRETAADGRNESCGALVHRNIGQILEQKLVVLLVVTVLARVSRGINSRRAVEGVVVTALGLKRDEKSLGYAASKVDGDVLASSATSTNWLSGLTGQVPD